MKKDITISFIRVVAMGLIIICHIFSETRRFTFLGQVFNVGVYTFIFLSGYLFGKKDIPNTKDWLLKRALRILIPMYIFMIFLFIIRGGILGEGLELSNYVIYALNLQGVLGGVNGGSHLWFLTAIMFCYLITPILNMFKGKVKELKKIEILVCLIIMLIIQMILSYLPIPKLGVYSGYVVLYIFAYFYSYLESTKITKNQLVILTILMIISILFRFISRTFLDGSILYNTIIVSYSQSIFGVWIFMFLSQFKKLLSNNFLSKCIDYIDKISFEVYIVHYMFFVGPLRVMNLTNSFLINVIIALTLTYISAVILNKICKLVYKCIKL